jgi:hypothetical protein
VSVGGLNKSYLLSEYHPSPFYVAQLSTSIFQVGNKPYCGTVYVRCLTITYTITLLNPANDNYIICVENGYYFEDSISVSTGQNVTIIGSSLKYTLLSPNFPTNSFFFLFNYVIFFF